MEDKIKFLKTCSSIYGSYLDSGTCISCPNGCSSCSNLNNCSSCKNSYYLSNSTCSKCSFDCIYCHKLDSCLTSNYCYYLDFLQLCKFFICSLDCNFCLDGNYLKGGRSKCLSCPIGNILIVVGYACNAPRLAKNILII